MANDRIGLRCKVCGEEMSWMKYFPSSPRLTWLDLPDGTEHERMEETLMRYGARACDLSEWVMGHLQCRIAQINETGKSHVHLFGDYGLEFVTES